MVVLSEPNILSDKDIYSISCIVEQLYDNVETRKNDKGVFWTSNGIPINDEISYKSDENKIYTNNSLCAVKLILEDKIQYILELNNGPDRSISLNNLCIFLLKNKDRLNKIKQHMHYITSLRFTEALEKRKWLRSKAIRSCCFENFDKTWCILYLGEKLNPRCLKNLKINYNEYYDMDVICGIEGYGSLF